MRTPIPALFPVLFGCTLLAQSDGINERFLNPDMKVEEFTQTFESDNREIFARRHELLAALALERGQKLADIGAGTGVFMALFSAAVGADGQVIALDIAPKFVDHMKQRSAREGLTNVTVIQNHPDDIGLPEHSLDVAFVCDTYHHFEQVAPILASIFRALRPGGRLVVVDFDREGPHATDWIRGHVRASKQVFRAEIEAAGFRFSHEATDVGLKENFMAFFTRP